MPHRIARKSQGSLEAKTLKLGVSFKPLFTFLKVQKIATLESLF